ncbi:MAG: small subunit ribosomal protein S9 [Candidatus Paceibacteria bacterium]|jgi:small subunit ribosomal protein S9
MATKTTEKYIEGIGRRKESVARVRITPSKKASLTVNDKNLDEYFKTENLQNIAQAAFNDIELEQKFTVTAKIKGGGTNSQAESLRLGTARALVEFNAELRGGLKKLGYMKRDPRVVERKKFGLKKARKAAQWSKR